MDLVQFLEEQHNNMSEYSLIDNLRDLTNLLSIKDNDFEKGNLSVRYRKGDIREGSLESMMGQCFDFNDIVVSETDSFHYQDELILAMEAINEDTCLVGAFNSDCIEQVNKKNKKGKKIYTSGVQDVCLTDNGDLYATHSVKDCIVRLSQLDTVSTAFSTAPLKNLSVHRRRTTGHIERLSVRTISTRLGQQTSDQTCYTDW